jgi:hypothetical protein
MAWFNPNDPIVSMAFLDAKGTLNASMDIIPSRITWLGDPDEVVGGLAVQMLRSGGQMRWNPYAWDHKPKTAEWQHPLALFGAQSLGIHLGAPLPNAGVWRLDGDHVVAPDGQSWHVVVFCGSFNLGEEPHGAERLHLLMDPAPSLFPVAPLVRGALLALEGACPQTRIPGLCRAVLGCAPTRKGRQPSRSTVDKAQNHAGMLASLALGNHLVQGNRAYAPERLVVAHHLFPAEIGEGSMWRALGQEAAQIILDSKVPTWVLESELAGRGGANDGVSAHTLLLARHALQRIQDLFRAAFA